MMGGENRAMLRVTNLTKEFPINQGVFKKSKVAVHAVTDVSFEVREGETMGLVGESGCGKSTAGRSVLRLIEPTSGTIEYKGRDITNLPSGEMRMLRRELQMIFQDPYTSLNPRIQIGKIVEEPMRIFKMYDSNKEYRDRAMEMLSKVGIRPDQYTRYPHEFSGGQRQRIGLARTLVLNPKMIICDEPVSALDVSTQSQVLNLLAEIKEKMGITYIFISHNMSVVKYVSDHIGVMYLGHMVEQAPSEEMFANPLHPYTRALLSAVPEVNPEVKKERIVLPGDIPSPINSPSGCVFHNRCPYATEECTYVVPAFREVAQGHKVACAKAGQI
ncbi:ABC transporter ATP-binding protein [Bianquea renquensis]|jgi:oligopeptide/dipeptide ABC transporter, ATP-binding protein, C-terminal domain|uniref:Dipeptide ABC transporter ATP-binding protein n=1 Tax=Bianquea renquensis TaxID=2763661 RepID=A0A926I0K5_9FIRM|nr:dipeptide ABC transporter ATP-binding protein [Bianquea renquensis]MBC8542553.1 dipeptide ABC transporter ATP-binding protein [Bianquea renquensis]